MWVVLIALPTLPFYKWKIQMLGNRLARWVTTAKFNKV
jgi:hypothetical protein